MDYETMKRYQDEWKAILQAHLPSLMSFAMGRFRLNDRYVITGSPGQTFDVWDNQHNVHVCSIRQALKDVFAIIVLAPPENWLSDVLKVVQHKSVEELQLQLFQEINPEL